MLFMAMVLLSHVTASADRGDALVTAASAASALRPTLLSPRLRTAVRMPMNGEAVTGEGWGSAVGSEGLLVRRCPQCRTG